MIDRFWNIFAYIICACCTISSYNIVFIHVLYILYIIWHSRNDIVPIVFGARPEDYRLVAPPNSYIQTDDFTSPQQLAEYLHKVDTNDTLYNEYLHWKGSGEFIDTKFWCRLCAMLHEAHSSGIRVWYDVNKWWHGNDVCLSDPGEGWLSWRQANDNIQHVEDSYHIIMPWTAIVKKTQL